jgi:hypothetical protein
MRTLLPICIGAAVTLLVSCGTSTTTNEAMEPEPAPSPDAQMMPDMVEPGPPLGSIEGRLITREGEPIAGLTVLCCDKGICIMGGSDEGGAFVCEDLELGAYKMQVADPDENFVDMVFYQTVEEEGANLPAREIVVSQMTETPSGWEAEAGGDVVLASGRLTLTADPGALSYPVGTREEALIAQEIPTSTLPPYDHEPWLEAPDRALAFFMDPVHVSSSSPVSIVAAAPTEAPGTVFQVWSVDPDTGTLQDVGTATVDDELRLVSDSDAVITNLTALILTLAL